MLHGVLLDIDGTLLDSNAAHVRAWVEVFEGIGLSLPYEYVRAKIGKGGDKVLLEVAGIDADSPVAKIITEHRQRILRARYIPELGPTHGARELLLHMKESGLMLMAATSAGEELAPLLVAAGISDLVDAVASADDTARSSRFFPFLGAAIEQSGFPAHELIMLADTPYDVQAGERAGVHVIALRCGGWGDADLAGAIAIYDDPADLLAHYDVSPLAGDISHDTPQGEPWTLTPPMRSRA